MKPEHQTLIDTILETDIESLICALKERRVQLRFARIKAAAENDPAPRDTCTEHCCLEHGCKYSKRTCSVVTGKKAQSFPCEACESEY